MAPALFARPSPLSARPLAALALFVVSNHACAPIGGDSGGPAKIPDPGLATHPDDPFPAPQGSRALADLSLSHDHACLLRMNGHVECWGDNEFGQLGRGDTGGAPTPSSVIGLSGVVALGTGEHHSCALRFDGRVFCWGDNRLGQLGSTTIAGSPTPFGVELGARARALSVGGQHACALLVDGRVRCWGDDRRGQIGPGSGGIRELRAVQGAVAIATGRNHSCAIRNDRSTLCWGANDHGQLGDESGRDHARPGRVRGLGPARELSLGDDRSCARHNGGWSCWGQGPSGRSLRAQPLPRIDQDLSLAVANGHACAHNPAGQAWCWGNNPDGRLGLGHLENRPQPQRIALDAAVRHIAISDDRSCAGLDQGRVVCWGHDPRLAMPEAELHKPKAGDAIRVAGLNGALELVTGPNFACARHNSDGASMGGQVSCWGQFPTLPGTNRKRSLHTIPDIDDALSLAAGHRHLCLTRVGGELRCYGDNRSGQARPPQALAAFRVRALTAGEAHSCALLEDGRVSCWGSNEFGQLGLGDSQSQPRPGQAVRGLRGMRALSSGARHNCALSGSGELYCWGDNREGQLGLGTSASALSIPVHTPQRVPGLRGNVEISLGRDHGCARARRAKPWCWGNNRAQQLGSGTLSDVWTTAIPTKGPRGLEGVSAGYDNACALRRGVAHCWGQVGGGLLGAGSPNLVGTPTVAPGSGLVEVSTGEHFACGRSAEGDVFCWGDDQFGQLGTSEARYVSRPSTVAGL